MSSDFGLAVSLLSGKGYTLKPEKNKFRLNAGRLSTLESIFKDTLDEVLSDIGREGEHTFYLLMKKQDKIIWIVEFAEYLLTSKRHETKSFLHIKVGIDIETGDDVLINTEKGRAISDVDYSVEACKKIAGKDEWNFMQSIPRGVKIVFDIKEHRLMWKGPYNGTTLDHEEVIYLNAACPPTWMLNTCVDDYPNKLPEDVQSFFDFFVPDEKERHILLSWMHNCLVGVNSSAMVLSGLGGTGKSIISSAIMSAIMGSENASPAPAGFLEGNWNSMLKNLRFMYHDEVGLPTQTSVDNMKAYLNETLTLNEKFKNSEKKSKVLCSHMITCNDLDFHFDPTDRKFSAIQITNKRLYTFWDEKKVTAFRRRFETDLEFIAQVGWYFYRYETDISPHDNGYKGPKFWDLLFESLPIETFKGFFTQYVKGMDPSEPETEYSIVRKHRESTGIKGRPKHGFTKKVRDWIESFESEGIYLARLYTSEVEGSNQRMVQAYGDPVEDGEDSADFDDL